MSIEAMKLAAEFNRYFTSANGVDVPAKVSVSRDEWRALFTAIQQAEAQQSATGEPVAWLDEMLADTREVFDAGGSETPQVVRDVIEYVKSWVTVYSEKNHQAPAAQPAPSEPATGEPAVSRNPFASRCYTMSESHLSGHRLIVGFEKLGDAQDAHEWVARQGRGGFTHPAPSSAVTPEPVGYMNEGHIHELAMRRLPYGYVYPEAGAGASTAVYAHPAPSGLGDSKRLDYLQDSGATIDLIAGVAAFYPMRFRVGGLHSSASIDVRAAIDAAMLAAK